MTRISAALALIALASCSLQPSVVEGPDLDATAGAVVAVDPLAAAAGARVLAEGGNAVDAAIATAFALAVTWPPAGNLGGGGFLLFREAGGAAHCIDYRETAPRAARPDMFLDADGKVAKDRIALGFLGAGVPGTVAGMALAHRRFGALAWSRLLEPAIDFAEDGFEVSPALAKTLKANAEALRRFPASAAIFLREDGAPLAAGDELVQRDLGRSLRRIAEDGEGAFYRGDVAERIVAASQANGGILALEDFAAYAAIERAPLVGSYRGCEVTCVPPPSSGGQVLIESLNQLERFELNKLDLGSADELHLLLEAQRRSFLDRARHLGDPDFVTIPLDDLLGKEHGRMLAGSIHPEHASKSNWLAQDLAGTLAPEPEHTTHFSVVDRAGNAVANTYTLEEAWGGKAVAEGTGILLNNEMGDFNPQPGVSDRTGRIGTKANVIAPGKRMLSSMCPVIVTRDGALELVAGSPGGRTIPSTMLRVVTAVVDHACAPRLAIELARVHHGLYPDEAHIEKDAKDDVKDSLRARGHALKVVDAQGDCHAIGRDPIDGVLKAAADRRVGGGAAALEK